MRALDIISHKRVNHDRIVIGIHVFAFLVACCYLPIKPFGENQEHYKYIVLVSAFFGITYKLLWGILRPITERLERGIQALCYTQILWIGMYLIYNDSKMPFYILSAGTSVLLLVACLYLRMERQEDASLNRFSWMLYNIWLRLLKSKQKCVRIICFTFGVECLMILQGFYQVDLVFSIATILILGNYFWLFFEVSAMKDLRWFAVGTTLFMLIAQIVPFVIIKPSLTSLIAFAYRPAVNILFLLQIILMHHNHQKKILKNKQKLLEEQNQQLENQKQQLGHALLNYQTGKIELDAANETLQKKNAKLKELEYIIQEAKIAVSIMDVQGNIAWMNQKAATWYAYKAGEQKNIKDINEYSDIVTKIAECVEKRTAEFITTPTNSDSSKNLHIHTTLTHIHESKKIVMIDFDITMLQLYYKTIAHEISNNIDPILSAAKRLLERSQPEANQADAHVIYRQGVDTQQLCENSLAYLAINTLKCNYSLINEDLKDTLKRAVRPFELIAAYNGIDITIHGLENEDTYCKTAHNILERVISNCLNNSIESLKKKQERALNKHTHLRIQIEVVTQNNHLQIKISDTGIGIEQDLEKIKYFDGVKVRWGLNLNKELLALIDGNTLLEKNSIGQGCTFTISLKNLKLFSKQN